MNMYSPKIKEDLIPHIYRLGKAYKKPMTKVVDEILRDYLSDVGDFEDIKRKRGKHKLHRTYTHSL